MGRLSAHSRYPQHRHVPTPLFRGRFLLFCLDCAQKKTRVRLWLYEDTRMFMEGIIIGFDEYMNVVLDDAVEMDTKKNARLPVGRCLLKGDSITLIQYV
jgi:small nuclear ribonucleoprotein E